METSPKNQTVRHHMSKDYNAFGIVVMLLLLNACTRYFQELAEEDSNSNEGFGDGLDDVIEIEATNQMCIQCCRVSNILASQ